jgi:two-component system, NtrC family, nitrogen regulation sensor histidine kinase NtrY
MSDAQPAPRAGRILGTTARRVALAIFVTALLPLLGGTLAARALLARVSATAFQPEFGEHLDRSLGVYADLTRAIKQEMRAEGDALAASPPLHTAAAARDKSALDAELTRVFAVHPSLAAIAVETCGGEVLSERRRLAPVDPTTERTLHVLRTLPSGPRDTVGDPGECLADRPDEPFALRAVFATPRARLDELEEMVTFKQAYDQIEKKHREEYVDETYTLAFAALLFATLLLAVAAAALVVRPVARGLSRLTEATRLVGDGDLSVRVALPGDDEVADLGRAFDRMLEELAESRARVEFLRRLGEWQKVARRLAHEIKNPLTPIQLAVEECHRRYRGDDPDFQRVLSTTFEVVTEEVGSLRRLVGEFSEFARLPRAAPRPADLGAFLRDQGARFSSAEGDGDRALFRGVEVTFAVPPGPAPAVIDEEMLHRVLGNLIRNAAEALRDARGGKGRVVVSAEAVGEGYEITVDDDGPGIPDEVAPSLFDPYVTTKRDGTGLGLSIVKKIVMDHGGAIEAGRSPLGGARFRLSLPRDGSGAARAVLERGEPGPESARAAG